MRVPWLLVLAALIAGVSSGFGVGYLVGHDQELPKSAVKKLSDVAPTKASDNFVLQNGKVISLPKLMAIYLDNPNRFVAMVEESKFHVEGHIAKVGEVMGTEDISGFYIPFVSSTDPVAGAVADIQGRGGFTEPVSIFVKGLTKTQIASLNPGQTIKVDCPRVRIVTDAFVFDDCQLSKGQTP